MKFISLEVTNWGPYQNRQVIDFSNSPDFPVTIIYGENGKGKTSLFRAISYALYGREFETSGKNKFNPDMYANKHQILKGERFSVSVMLSFEISGKRYESHRKFDVVPNTSLPNGFKVENEGWYVNNDGKILTQDEARAKIRSGLPRDISRFFLFDGEDLKNVLDDLSTNNATERRSIKMAINSLLGLPSLEKLVSEIESETSSLKSKIESTSKNYVKSTKLKNEIDEKKEKIETLIQDMRESTDSLNRVREDIRSIEPLLNSSAANIINSLRKTQSELDYLKGNKEEKMDSIRQVLSSQWFLPIHKRIQSESENLKEHKKAREAILRELHSLNSEYEAIEKSLNSQVCYACKQHIEDKNSLEDDQRSLKEKIAGRKAQLDKIPETRSVWGEIESRLDLQSSLTVIEKFKDITRSIAIKQGEVDDFKKQLEGVDAGSLESIGSKYKSLLKSESNYEKNIEELGEEIREEKTELQRMETRYVDAQDVSKDLRDRYLYYSELILILKSTIEQFRVSVKKRVEEVASAHYVNLIENEDITGLSITEDYQVKIVHKELGEKDLAAFGQNLLLVYSFIGALTDVSGNDSGLVVDTPIARLDKQNQERVWRWLANRGRQVIVLPHSAELTRQQSEQFMDGRIGREYEISPLSADAWSEVKQLTTGIK